MGVDIHIIIEVQESDNNQWMAISDEVYMRDYTLFAAIAFGEDGSGKGILFPTRGLPEDHSVVVREKYFDPAIKSIRVFNSDTLTFEQITSPTKIEKLLSNKVERDVYKKYRLLPGDRLSGTSWLTLEELERVLDYSGIERISLYQGFVDLIRKMTKTAKKSGKDKVRMVFWFTN